jgi:hypothetical protein
MYRDGVCAQPRLGVGLAIELLEANGLEGRGPLDGSQPVGEGKEAVEVVAGVVVDDNVHALSGRVVVVAAVAVVPVSY